MPKHRRPRRVQLEQCEDRRVMTSIAYPFAPLPETLSAVDDGYVVRRDAADTELAVLSNDFDWSSDDPNSHELLRIVAVTAAGAGAGTIGIAAGGRAVEYSPTPGYTGIDSFSYSIQNEAGDTTEASVFVNIVEPLFALDDWEQASPNTTVELSVLSNDGHNAASFAGGSSSPSGLHVTEVGSASHGGQVSISSDGQRVVYTPAADFSGSDSFSYTIADELGHRATAEVHVTVGDTGGLSQERILHQLVEAALETYASQYGQYQSLIYDYFHDGDRVFLGLQGWFRATGTDALTVAGSVAALQTAGGAAADSVSQTHLQVDGVDEGDIVKTDGDYLYVLSDWMNEETLVEEHQLTIVSVSDPSQPFVVSRYDFADDVLEMYLHGDRISVISQYDGGITYTLLDVSDRMTPTLVGESDIAGHLEASRAIGDQLYVIVKSFDAAERPHLEVVCAEAEEGCFYETRQQFHDRIREIARLTVESRDGEGNIVETRSLLEGAVGLDLADLDWQHTVTAVVTFEVDSAATTPLASTVFAHGTTGEIYVSAEAIYLFDDPSYGRSSGTTIHKLQLEEDGGSTLAATGTVPGYLLNRFSADEFAGYLRVATTSDTWGGDNNLYVLQQVDDQLEIVGSVERLAPGERIFSARFDGNRGFVVTFRQVDPLFVFDLSDPTNPQALGALKVSGYSNYLQVIDENHLLGIGREANSQGLYQEMQVSVFDVSDFSNPLLKHRYTFEGGRRLWSPVMAGAWNLGTHHAVSYFADRGILVMPIYGDAWNWQGTAQTANVMMRVLDIDLESGISSLGQVEFDDPFNPHLARSVRAGDVLYSISPEVIKASELRSPEQLLGEVFIGQGATDDRFSMRGSDAASFDVLANDAPPAADRGSLQIVSIDQPQQGGTVAIDEAGRRVVFRPAAGQLGPVTFSYTLGSDRYREVGAVTVDVRLAWNNSANNHDVNQDGHRSAIDALGLINFMNAHGAGSIDALEAVMTGLGNAQHPLGPLRPDVDNDGYVSSMDLLMLVNYLNSVDSVYGPVPQTAHFDLRLAADKEPAAAAQAVEQVSTEPLAAPIFGPIPATPSAARELREPLEPLRRTAEPQLDALAGELLRAGQTAD